MSEPRSLLAHLRRSLAFLGLSAATAVVGVGAFHVAADHGFNPFVEDLRVQPVDGRDVADGRPGPQARRVAALDARFACSHTGLPEGVVPAHAVVQVGSRVRVVGFDAGWAVYEGRRPGSLVSVCAR
jgi:hypothetical protein